MNISLLPGPSGGLLHGWVIGVAVILAAKERGRVEIGERKPLPQAGGQVGVGNKRTSESDEVGITALKHPVGALDIVLAGDDDRASEARANLSAKLLGELRGVVPIGLDEMQIGNLLGSKKFDCFQDCGQ